nr:MAG: RusA family crossover junction endodeoxyribonuclease [Chloroflexota bacterium]
MIGENARETDWKDTVASWASHAMKKAGVQEPLDGAIRLEVVFFLQRPQNHYNSAGKLKAKFNDLHTTKPDATKLLRCLEDALKQIVWRNDSQVCTTIVSKRYGAIPGAQVTISEESPEGGTVTAAAPTPQQASFFNDPVQKTLHPLNRGAE